MAKTLNNIRNIFSSKTTKIINIVNKLKEKEDILLIRNKELKAVLQKKNFDHDTLTIYGEVKPELINGYTPRIDIRGFLKRKILIKILKDDIEDLESSIKELQKKL